LSELNIPKNAYAHHLTVGGVTFTVRTWDRDGDYRQGEALFVGYQTGGKTHTFTHIPYEDEAFSWLASYLKTTSWGKHISVLVEGEAQAITPGPLKSENPLRLIGPIWAPVANIVEERSYGPGGAETRQGTKHFRPGAKVYVSMRLGHFKRMSLEVIGRHRASHRYVTMVVRASWLTRWRVELVYIPHIIEQIWWGSDGTEASRLYYEDWIQRLAGATA
jgi:hypothetical protein